MKLHDVQFEDGAEPDRYEKQTAQSLAARGKAVKFLAPSRVKGARTPDIRMSGVTWEIKIPRKNGKYTIEHAVRSGLGQSRI